MLCMYPKTGSGFDCKYCELTNLKWNLNTIESHHEDTNIQPNSLPNLNILISFTSTHTQRHYPGLCSCH